MKITRYMGAFAVIAMLAACSTDDELGANTAANEVKIAATIGGNSIFTRSNPVGSATEQTSFNEGDAISVTTEGKTVIYTKKDGQWANANDYLVWTGNAQTFEACYPEKADKTTDHATFKYSAIVIPQRVYAGQLCIKFKVDGTDYIWTGSDDALFESGKKYELHLLVGKDVVQGGAISAKPWGDETITEKETD